MGDKRSPMEVIMQAMSERALLEQLAEEAAELAQAALKLIRVRGNGNPTPVTVGDAEAALIEELSDVALVAAALGISKDSVLMDKKAARWVERIQKAGCKKVCGTCWWHDEFTGACCNGDSEYRGDFTEPGHGCEMWEEAVPDVKAK